MEQGFLGRAGEIERSLRTAECNHVDIDWFGIILSVSQESRVPALACIKGTVGQTGSVAEEHMIKFLLPSGFTWKASLVFSSMNRRVL